jgi:hypothetical protein
VIKRTGHQHETRLGMFHSVGAVYLNERTNHTTLFSLGFLQSGSGRRAPVSAAPRQLDINPLNVQPKTP